MTPEEKTIQDLRRDLLFVLTHPMERCKVCLYRDADCDKDGCVPAWIGDGKPVVTEYGGAKK